MFGFREIRTVEKNLSLKQTEKEESKEYLKIKPETEMTVDEAKDFIGNLFKF